MPNKVFTQIITGANPADLKNKIDAWLSYGSVILKDCIHVFNNTAICFYWAPYNPDDSLRFGSPYIVLSADGSDVQIYQYIYPAVIAKGVPMTFYNCTGQTGSVGFMSWAQVIDMWNNGIDIQCHGHTHTKFTELTVPEIIAELTEVNNQHIAHGIPAPVHNAYPYGVFNATVKATVATMRNSGRTLEPYQTFPQWLNVDKFELNAARCDINILPEHEDQIKAGIDQVAANNTVFHIYTHGYNTQAKFESIIQYGIDAGCTFIDVPGYYALLP